MQSYFSGCQKADFVTIIRNVEKLDTELKNITNVVEPLIGKDALDTDKNVIHITQAVGKLVVALDMSGHHVLRLFVTDQQPVRMGEHAHGLIIVHVNEGSPVRIAEISTNVLMAMEAVTKYVQIHMVCFDALVEEDFHCEAIKKPVLILMNAQPITESVVKSV